MRHEKPACRDEAKIDGPSRPQYNAACVHGRCKRVDIPFCRICTRDRSRRKTEDRHAGRTVRFHQRSRRALSALLDRPAGSPRATALFAHCFTCGKDIHAAKRIAAGLTALGIAVLRFDFTGLGSSEGEFANTTFSSNVDDLIAAATAHARTGHRARPADRSQSRRRRHSCGRCRNSGGEGGGDDCRTRPIPAMSPICSAIMSPHDPRARRT